MTSHTQDAVAMLAAANPVPDLPAVEPAERLRRLIEADGRSAAVAAGRRRRSKGSVARATTALVAALAAATAGMLLADGSAAPGVNIAAAAYAATSSGSGVLEARFVEHMLLPGRSEAGSHYRREVTFHYREWIDASRGMRREQRALPAILSRPRHVVEELASSPRWIEVWSSAGANEIHRIGDRAMRVPAAFPRLEPGDAAAPAPAGIATFRRLYRERGLEFIGRERWHGRLLWKLEGDVAFVRRSTHAKLVPIMALVVLVDPRTYLPAVQRQVALGPSGRLGLGLPRSRYARTIQTESELVGYRRLHGGASSEALLKLSAQHPRARILTTGRPSAHGGARRREERNTVEAFLVESARALAGAL